MDNIIFVFRPRKTVEAAATFLKLHDKPMKYLGLLKMLYLADRIALSQMEQPITGDRYVSMKYGPVLSIVYDLVKENERSNNHDFVNKALPIWSKFISSKKNHKVSLLKLPEIQELCEEEEEIIEKVYQTFGKLDPFTVAEWTHDLKEWQNPGNSAIPIKIEDILVSIEKSQEEIEEIRKEASREAYLSEVLND